MKRLCLAVLVVTGCAPPAPTPEGQQAEFAVKTLTPTIGSLVFGADGSNLVAGSLDLDAALITTHPMRVGIVWLGPPIMMTAVRFRQPGLVQNGQESIVVETSAGSHPFSLMLPTPPPEALGGLRPDATVVAYIDVNENGVLDLSSAAPLIDHVLTSADFPQAAFGYSAGQTLIGPRLAAGDRLPLFDDPLLDLVACTREDRYVVENACGVPVFVKPRVYFAGRLTDERIQLAVESQPNDQITLDGEPYVVDGDFAKFATGQHELRAVGPTGGVFEATFTLPEPIEVVSIASAGFTAGGAPQHDVQLKQLTGALQYRVRSNTGTSGSSDTTTVRVDKFDARNFSAEVLFVPPFHATAQFPKR